MRPLPSDTPLPSSPSSSSSSPTIGLQSPGLQAEFLKGKSHTNTSANGEIHNHDSDGLVCLGPVFRDRFNSDNGLSGRVSYPLPPPFSPTPSSPRTPTSSPPSPCANSRQGRAGVSLSDWNKLMIVMTLMSLCPARLSLSSPELLSELKDSRARTLRHVVRHSGMTTVFSGRGRGQVGRDH